MTRAPAVFVAHGAPTLALEEDRFTEALRRVRLDDKDAPVDSWASEFDAWVRDRLQRRDIEGLMAYRTAAPKTSLAVPESEHIDPLFLVLGAAAPEDRVVPVFEGFQHGNLSLRSVALEP